MESVHISPPSTIAEQENYQGTGKHQNVKDYSSSRKYHLTIKFIPNKAKKKKDSGRWEYKLLSLKRHCKKTGKTRNQVLNKVI